MNPVDAAVSELRLEARVRDLEARLALVESKAIVLMTGIVIGGCSVSTGASDPQNINGSHGITSISRQSVGRYRFTLPFSVVSSSNIWATATVSDNASWYTGCVPVSASPAQFDLYVFDSTTTAIDGRTVNVHYIAKTI